MIEGSVENHLKEVDTLLKSAENFLKNKDEVDYRTIEAIKKIRRSRNILR